MFKGTLFLLILLLILFFTEGVPGVLAQGPSPTPTVTPAPTGQPASGDDPFTGFQKAVDELGKTFDRLLNFPTAIQDSLDKGLKGGFKTVFGLFFGQWADNLFGHPFLDFSGSDSFVVGLANNMGKITLLVGTVLLFGSLGIKIIRYGRGDDVGSANNLVWHGVWTVVILLLSAGLPYLLNQLFSRLNKLITDTLHGELPFLPHTDAVKSLEKLVLGMFQESAFLWVALIIVAVFVIPRLVLRLIEAKVVVFFAAVFGLGAAGASVLREDDQLTAKKTLEVFVRHSLELLYFAIILALLVNLSTTDQLISISAWMLLASLLILRDTPFQLAQATVTFLRLNSAAEEESIDEAAQLDDEQLDGVGDLGGIDDDTGPKALRRS